MEPTLSSLIVSAEGGTSLGAEVVAMRGLSERTVQHWEKARLYLHDSQDAGTA